MLFEAALGQWDLTIYENVSIGKYFGIMFHIVFLMINLVMLLNLIIAILANIYNIYEHKSLAIYYDSIIESIPMFRYSKEYGSLVCG